jgi:D-lactate dehydrogenase (cytochrome)
LLDAAVVRVTNAHQNLSLREAPTLFVEFDGSEAAIEEQIDFFRELCEDNHCTDLQTAIATDEREKLWTARREAHDSIKYSHAGCTMISGDVCVPLSKFEEMVEFVHELAPEMGVLIYAFGHAGDGNLHTETIACKENGDEFQRGLQATDRLIEHAIALGGTATGEHGVGLGKMQFMKLEHGPSLGLMRALKTLLDPKGIMNPGKIFPDE